MALSRMYMYIYIDQQTVTSSNWGDYDVKLMICSLGLQSRINSHAETRFRLAKKSCTLWRRVIGLIACSCYSLLIYAWLVSPPPFLLHVPFRANKPLMQANACCPIPQWFSAPCLSRVCCNEHLHIKRAKTFR